MAGGSHVDPTLFGYDDQSFGLDSTLGTGLNFTPHVEHYDSGYSFAAGLTHQQGDTVNPAYQAGQWPSDGTNPFFEQQNEFDPLFDHQHEMLRRVSVASGERALSGGGVKDLVSAKAKRQ